MEKSECVSSSLTQNVYGTLDERKTLKLIKSVFKLYEGELSILAMSYHSHHPNRGMKQNKSYVATGPNSLLH